MPRLRVDAFSLSLDGCGAGPNQSIDDPFGENGLRLTEWMVTTRTFQRMVGTRARARPASMTTSSPGPGRAVSVVPWIELPCAGGQGDQAYPAQTGWRRIVRILDGSVSLKSERQISW